MTQHSWQRDFLWLFFAILLFFCIGLGARPYLTPSEARYIEVPRQMLATGDWLTPRINGVPYFEKPPLFYWMQASVMQFFGPSEFAGRIVTALLSTLLCLVTYATGRLLHNRLSGLLAACVLATCALGYILSRVAMLDVPVSLFLTLCFACFLAAQHTGKRNWYWGMYAASALAVMSKGLIGIVIPGLVIGPWILITKPQYRTQLLIGFFIVASSCVLISWYVASKITGMDSAFIGIVIPGLVIGAWIAVTKHWNILKEARLFTGLLLFLFIATPWHVLMAREHPAFFDFYFIHEHFQRFLTDEARRTQPWWFFLGITLAGLLPWTGLLLAAADVRCQMLDVKKIFLNIWPPTSNIRLFLLLWILLPLLFFSASHSKLAPYIFPIFPPLCIMLGHYLAECWDGRIKTTGLRANCFGVAALFSALILVYYFVPLPIDPNDKLDFATGITFPMLMPIIIALAGLVYVALSKRAAPVVIGALLLFAAVFDISANMIAAGLDRASVKPLAAILKERLHDGDMVASFGAYFQDLPIYLNRNVVVADYLGELEFGVTHYPETHGWMLTADQFWQRCADDKQPLYVFIKNTTYDGIKIPANCRLRVIAKYGKTVLLEKETK